MESNATLKCLADHDVKPSLQRIAVLGYLMEHRTHPTVEEIYQALHPQIPTLSKTTVYNTLRLLTEKGAALQLTIDDKKVCFDADTSAHAHFLCRRCGKVYDIRLRQTDLQTEAEMPDGFAVEQSDLYFHGICKNCLDKLS